MDRPTFFFSFELVLPESPRRLEGPGSRLVSPGRPASSALARPDDRTQDSAKSLLQSAPSLCRMVVVVLSDSPHQQSNRAEIGRISRPPGEWTGLQKPAAVRGVNNRHKEGGNAEWAVVRHSGTGRTIGLAYAQRALGDEHWA